jgi:hypothetical protein
VREIEADMGASTFRTKFWLAVLTIDEHKLPRVQVHISGEYLPHGRVSNSEKLPVLLEMKRVCAPYLM